MKIVKYRVYKYAAQDVDSFQRTIIDLAKEIKKNLHNPEELTNISNTLKEVAYNKPIELPKMKTKTNKKKVNLSIKKKLVNVMGKRFPFMDKFAKNAQGFGHSRGVK